jgi:ATP-dependent helicase/nuclease subunit B
VIDLGDKRRVVLHGWIDRINRVGAGNYEVADYKTGGYWADDWQGEFDGGRRLQHALYGLAAASLLERRDAKARVVRGVYLFTAVKGHRRRKVIEAPTKAKIVQVLRDLTDVIGNGAFAPADGELGCKWCEFKAACHAEDVTLAAGKVANLANKVLQPYRDLRGNHA